MGTAPPAQVDAVGLPFKLSRVELRIAPDDLRTWKAAAKRSRLKLSEWIRQACDARIPKDFKQP